MRMAVASAVRKGCEPSALETERPAVEEGQRLPQQGEGALRN